MCATTESRRIFSACYTLPAASFSCGVYEIASRRHLSRPRFNPVIPLSSTFNCRPITSWSRSRIMRKRRRRSRHSLLTSARERRTTNSCPLRSGPPTAASASPPRERSRSAPPCARPNDVQCGGLRQRNSIQIARDRFAREGVARRGQPRREVAEREQLHARYLHELRNPPFGMRGSMDRTSSGTAYVRPFANAEGNPVAHRMEQRAARGARTTVAAGVPGSAASGGALHVTRGSRACSTRPTCG